MKALSQYSTVSVIGLLLLLLATITTEANSSKDLGYILPSKEVLPNCEIISSIPCESAVISIFETDIFPIIPEKKLPDTLGDVLYGRLLLQVWAAIENPFPQACPLEKFSAYIEQISPVIAKSFDSTILTFVPNELKIFCNLSRTTADEGITYIVWYKGKSVGLIECQLTSANRNICNIDLSFLDDANLLHYLSIGPLYDYEMIILLNYSDNYQKIILERSNGTIVVIMEHFRRVFSGRIELQGIMRR